MHDQSNLVPERRSFLAAIVGSWVVPNSFAGLLQGATRGKTHLQPVKDETTGLSRHHARDYRPLGVRWALEFYQTMGA